MEASSSRVRLTISDKENSLTLLKCIESFAGVGSFFNDNNYTNSKINARGRKKIKFVEKLTHKKNTVTFLLKLFPKKLILSVRSYLDKRATKGTKENYISKLSESDINLAKNNFPEDSSFIKSLFKSEPIVFGDGSSFY